MRSGVPARTPQRAQRLPPRRRTSADSGGDAQRHTGRDLPALCTRPLGEKRQTSEEPHDEDKVRGALGQSQVLLRSWSAPHQDPPCHPLPTLPLDGLLHRDEHGHASGGTERNGTRLPQADEQRRLREDVRKSAEAQ